MSECSNRSKVLTFHRISKIVILICPVKGRKFTVKHTINVTCKTNRIQTKRMIIQRGDNVYVQEKHNVKGTQRLFRFDRKTIFGTNLKKYEAAYYTATIRRGSENLCLE